jgi:hypothetical protein
MSLRADSALFYLDNHAQLYTHKIVRCDSVLLHVASGPAEISVTPKSTLVWNHEKNQIHHALASSLCTIFQLPNLQNGKQFYDKTRVVCASICPSNMSIVSESLFDKAHVWMIRGYLSIFKYIILIFIYFQTSFKEYDCESVCLSRP